LETFVSGRLILALPITPFADLSAAAGVTCREGQ
jgi:hypothetical protein